MRKPVLFLDDGGVISDNNSRRLQYEQLVGGFLAARLGGKAEDWAAANRAIIDRFFAPGAWQTRLERYSDYWSFQRDYSLDWVYGMCDMVGADRPDEQASLRLMDESTRWVTPRVNAPFPEAVTTVKLLHGRGYALNTASGEASLELDGYLRGMGIREYFQRLYGTDLVDMPPKSGPVYYRRMFADAGVRPEDSVVVDDSAMALSWAADLGARCVLVDRERWAGRSQPDDRLTVIAGLDELPGVLDSRSPQYE